MQLLINSTKLQAPVVETLESYVSKKLERLMRLMPKSGENQIVRITARMERYEFVINVELNIGRPVFIQVKHPNLYAAVDRAHDVLKRSLKRKNGD